ncbi:MAG: ABC transporter ATP-binding protein/permease, partial [Defluviitaleaceae bacterium]|nr:ABC transporter ATP-binding protein/permease [Defluviitaleaceae bacterium]
EGIAAINTDADTAAEVFGQPMAFFFGMILTTILSAITVLIIDWRLGLGAMAIGALAFLIQIGFAPVMARLETRRLEENANSIKSMSNIFSGAAVIRAFGIEAKAEADLTQHVAQMQKIGMRGAWINMFRNMFTTIEGWLTMLLVFGMGGWLVARGELDLPMLLLILPMASSLSGAFAQIGTFWALLQPPMAACKRVFEILDKPGGGSRQRNILGSHWDGDYSIKVRDMNFRYLDGTLALRDIRLDIGKNKMVAFVGPSGSGKSTLLRAIIGMYERSDLGLTLGNLDFATASPTMWRARFAYVDQSHKLFDMTIAENIALGALNTASQNDIEQAAIRAYAHDFIAAIGYDADAGERGAALSGGEKQRIAIARALVKGAPILVFDEATSALDSESEQNIMDTINRLRPDHTILIATHNLAAITTADRIVVMNHGQIAEMGTHDSLMRKNGLYSNLFKDQKS